MDFIEEMKRSDDLDSFARESKTSIIKRLIAAEAMLEESENLREKESRDKRHALSTVRELEGAIGRFFPDTAFKTGGVGVANLAPYQLMDYVHSFSTGILRLQSSHNDLDRTIGNLETTIQKERESVIHLQEELERSGDRVQKLEADHATQILLLTKRWEQRMVEVKAQHCIHTKELMSELRSVRAENQRLLGTGTPDVRVVTQMRRAEDRAVYLEGDIARLQVRCCFCYCCAACRY
jgi:hypothetical protein